MSQCIAAGLGGRDLVCIMRSVSCVKSLPAAESDVVLSHLKRWPTGRVDCSECVVLFVYRVNSLQH